MPEASIFTRIINKEIPADIVWENERFVVIADARPVQPGHCLVIPKTQYTDLTDTPDEIASEAIAIAKRVGKATLSLPGVEGFNVNINNGAAAGQVVFHLHVHVIPRIPRDGFEAWHGSAEAVSKQSEACAIIRSVLSE